MNKDKTKHYASLFEPDGNPGLKKALPMALQHVLAMIVGCVTPAIIIAGVGGLDAGDKVILVQAALFIAAVSTLIQLFPIGKHIGSGLPMILGVGFAYLPTIQAIADSYDIATILGSQLIAGVCAVIVGLFIKKLRIFFPPMITGIVIFTIGLSLYPTAINYMAGGVASKTYGSWQNWLVALITLSVVIFCNHYAKGTLKIASILAGIIVGYIISLFFGMVNFDAVGSASALQLPKPMYFGMKFEPSAIISLSVLFVINSIQAVGDFTATTVGGMDREPSDRELQGGIVAYGLSNILGSFVGGLPTATYSQNVGIVSITKVVNRMVFALAAIIILIGGFVPKFSALLTTIPQCVLGGATISVFATIAMTGLKLIFKAPMNFRNTSVVGLSVAIGMGITQASASLAQFPQWVTVIFGKSPVVLATISAILLNHILPDPDRNKK
ncbi:uracil-xanthine permease family protein [Anaerobium acetethylicum]|uniref:Nucleobase:cation symporter-2, NCS2 family n=1 Tax=Anaerobium acetethylicum TaxID=1619234 RepID=A0A1D3TWZ8_9FIRM|nr:nucleobase:cation symporter-2 family protein [Anaerobium acetethylicum]SCP98817.1 nucleobase:cation symporter-2, NCS2 family [Anaerobium acetethylicum]